MDGRNAVNCDHHYQSLPKWGAAYRKLECSQLVLDAFAYSLPISILDFAVFYMVCWLCASNNIFKELTSLANFDIIGYVERSDAMLFELIKFAGETIASDFKALWKYCKELYEDDGGKIYLTRAIIAIASGLAVVFIFPRTVLVGVFIAWRLSRADEDDTDDD